MVLIDGVLMVFKKWYHIEEDYNVIAPMCAAIANFCPGEPDIIGLIGPSGSMKTEFIRSCGESENKYVYPISTLTDKTLVSGFKESNDIVPRLKGRLLTIKDLTSILAKNEDIRAGIFADFREITDGYIHKEFGNGVIKDYRDVHSSILFASTNGIEGYYSLHASLGQRIIFLRPFNDPVEARKKAVENRGKGKEMRLETHKAVMQLLESANIYVNETAPPGQYWMLETPKERREELGGFYDFLALARTPLHRNYRGEIDHIPEPEFPTRIANTISRLCEVHALVHGRDEANEEDVDFGARVVRDNIPTMRWQVLKAMRARTGEKIDDNEKEDWMTTGEINADKMSVGSIRYALEELSVLGLVERLSREETKSRYDSYRLTSSTLMQLDRLSTRNRYNRDLGIKDEESDSTSYPNSCGQSNEATVPECTLEPC
jgi:DNA-binding transcriptional ArsR family regulator